MFCFVFVKVILACHFEVCRENNKRVTCPAGVMKAFVFKVIWILSSSVQLGELSAAKAPVWCYCTPLRRYNSLFVQAKLHFDSVIEHSGYANPPFHRSDKYSTKVQHLPFGFIFRPVLPVRDRVDFRFKSKHKVMFVFVISHQCLCSHKGGFCHA